jgi:hypothetical protein
MHIIVLHFVLAQPRTDEPFKGDNADGDADVGNHDAQAVTSTHGASAVRMTENNTEADVPSSMVPT